MLGLFLSGIMLPIRLASVELFTLMKNLDLLDSLTGLILVYSAIRIPFAVFIFANFMRVLPSELEEAARMDGAGEVRILFQVILPQVRSRRSRSSRSSLRSRYGTTSSSR